MAKNVTKKFGWDKLRKLEHLGTVGTSIAVANVIVLMTDLVEPNVAPRFFQFIFWMFRGIEPGEVFFRHVGVYFPYYRVAPTLVEVLTTEIASMLYCYIPIAFFLSFPVMWISRRFTIQKESLITFSIVLMVSTLVLILIGITDGQYIVSPYGLYAHLILKPFGFISGPAIAYAIIDKTRDSLRTFLLLLFSLAFLGVIALFTVYLFIDRIDQSLAEGTLLLGPLFTFFLAAFTLLKRRYTSKELGFMSIIGGLLIVSSGFIAGKIWMFSTDQGNPWAFLGLHSILELWIYTEIAIMAFLTMVLARILMDAISCRFAHLNLD